MKFFRALCILFFSYALSFGLTIHVQNPFRNDASKADYKFHLLGAAGASYNPIFGENSTTMMAEESGWYSYTFSKNISAFQTWENFSFKSCPNTSDQNYNNNNCVAWTDADGKTLEFNVVGLFGSDSEIWLYTSETDPSVYQKSFVAPGSKIVWFKSPYGNKALPQMIFGKDSVLMRFELDNTNSCGWFYGALTPKILKQNPTGAVYFTRYLTPYLSLPEKGTFDISKALSSKDTVFIDGTSGLSLVNNMKNTGTCFDSSKTLHVYSPYRTNSTYKDSLLYISVGNNILNNPTAMDSTGEYKYWYKYDFKTSVTSKAEWNSSGALVQFYRRQNEWPQVSYFEEAKRPVISEFFPKGVYEAWLYTNTNGKTELSFQPLEEKVIRLMSPWDNMAPSLLIYSDTVKMGPFSPDTCGWYEARYYKHSDSFEVLFKQTFGFEYYSNKGLGDGDFIVLDSVLKTHDTVYIAPYPTLSSAPRLSATFPGRLGICPTLQISAMLVDWAGESFDPSIDIDFGGIYDGNEYTKVVFNDSVYQKCQGRVVGMVQDTLVNGLPARVDSLVYPWSKCAAGHEIEKWFVPVEVAKDNSGKSYTNATCRDIDLTLDAEGFWLADISEAHEDGGFFPLDDFDYLDSARTVKNPKFDWDDRLTAGGKKHNYSFAMKISAQFQYVKGQYFEFRGDDDVWVFINNKLVVDIGGCHGPEEASVDLDTLGLTEGETYPFHIFFSERNATGSNFKMRTSINLQTEKTYYPVQMPTEDGTIVYEIYQLLMDKSLSCDISSVSKIDTVAASSVFLLTGGSLPKEGVTLEPGLNYGGINITGTMSGFSIDTSAIVKSRKLAPGSYVLYFSLASDLTQTSKISFTVPEYPLPTISFADSLGTEISSDTVSFGEWAYVLYPVYVKVLYYGELCTDCIVNLNLSTEDSLQFFNEASVKIEKIKTDSTGYAKFYCMGLTSVKDASFKISSDEVDNELVWKNINLEKPPVPIPNIAEMHDRNGDGVADSLILKYSDVLVSDDYVLDTVGYAFGDSSFTKIFPNEKIKKYIEGDSSLVFTADSLVKFRFTGEKGEIYQGSSKSNWTYTDSTGKKVEFPIMLPITEKIPPVITKAVVTPKGERAAKLNVYFSESLDSSSVNDSILEFRIWREGKEVSSKLNILSTSFGKDYSYMEILFSTSESVNVLPAVGDSVHFKTGIAKDLSLNKAHKNNPWVRLEGEQKLRVEHSKVFVLKSEDIQNLKDSVSVYMFIVSSEKSFEKIQDEIKMPGQLIRFDLSELLYGSEDLEPEDLVIQWENYFFTNLGSFVNSASGKISCADKLFDGDCSKSQGLLYLAWNMKSKEGRLVGTGPYISKLDIKIKRKSKSVVNTSKSITFGIRRED